ncbi:hypothetical protein Hdeb2414_s0011g00369731 [Helianthus debilis subsp. tardiflorus]
MWMFILMMMVFTRTRAEEDSRVSTNQLVVEGSASTRVPIKNRRRKSKDITTTEPRVDPHVEQSTEQHANPPKNMPEGFKIPLTLDNATKAFIGTSATDFATELGIIVCDVLGL